MKSWLSIVIGLKDYDWILNKFNYISSPSQYKKCVPINVMSAPLSSNLRREITRIGLVE